MKFPWQRKRPEILPVEEAYNRWASSYAAEGNPVKNLSTEIIARMLPSDLSGKTALDAGCGPGIFCALMEQRGAKKVLGIDLSPVMIAAAKSKTTRTELRCDDISRTSLEPQSFDLILCALALGHIENLDKALGNILPSLKNTGILIISDFHPYLTLSGEARTFRDVKSGKTYQIAHKLHLLSEYFNLLQRHGLQVKALDEPLWKGWPVIFVLKALKTT